MRANQRYPSLRRAIGASPFAQFKPSSYDRYRFVTLRIGVASNVAAGSLRNVRGPNVLGEGNGSSEGQLVTEASTPTRTSSVATRETPIADHAYAGVTIAALLCATSAATFLTLFP